jgi:hypothetical protein
VADTRPPYIWFQPEHARYWKHKTRTGRVVYNRKKHYFNPKDLVRFVDRLEGQNDLLREYPIQVRYCWQIFNLSLFPAVADLFTNNETLKTALQNAGLWTQVQQLWKELTAFVADKAMEKAGIPLAIRKPLMDFLFPPLYDLIYGLFGPKGE